MKHFNMLKPLEGPRCSGRGYAQPSLFSCLLFLQLHRAFDGTPLFHGAIFQQLNKSRSVFGFIYPHLLLSSWESHSHWTSEYIIYSTSTPYWFGLNQKVQPNSSQSIIHAFPGFFLSRVKVVQHACLTASHCDQTAGGDGDWNPLELWLLNS